MLFAALRFFGAADHAPGETRDQAASPDAIGAADSAPIVQPIVELPDSPMDIPSDASPSEPESSWSSWGWITNHHSWSFPGSSRAPSVPGPSAPPPPSTVSPVPAETPPWLQWPSSSGAAPSDDASEQLRQPWLHRMSTSASPPEPEQPNVWESRLEAVRRVWATAVPQATAELHPVEATRPEANLPILSDFQHLADIRQRDMEGIAREELPLRLEQTIAAVTHQLQRPPEPLTAGHVDVVPDNIVQHIEFIQQHIHVTDDARTQARTRRREEAIARLLASVTLESPPDSEPPSPRDPRDINPYSPPESPRRPTQTVCTICLEQYEVGDPLVTLVCRHSFHRQCLDMWTATQMTRNMSPRCCCCRAAQEILSLSEHVEETASPV